MQGSSKKVPRRGGVLGGCLVALAIVGVVLIAGGIYVATNWRGWASTGVNRLVETGLNQSSIPDAEQQEVMAVVGAFTDEFEAGDISVEQFIQVAEKLAESPVMPAMIVMGIQQSYLAESELTDEEKADGSKQLSRFVRGLSEEKISTTKIDDVTEPIHAAPGDADMFAIHSNNLNIELKNPSKVTADELRAFLANAKAAADEADVPDEKIEIDWSDELQAAIDRGLGRAPALPEAGDNEAGDDESGDDETDDGSDADADDSGG
ncbi:MAG: hypothetical protein Q9O74_01055 [Planctomycetota bacterium]|nr:hypothetical protein [Planctomycetota bacterium]